MQLSEKDLEQSVKINLILSIENGDGLRDGFEGTECFGCLLREIDHKRGTPKSPVISASLLN